MRVNYLLGTILSAFILCNCTSQEDREEAQERIFDKFLYTIIDSLTSPYEVENKILVSHNLYPDKARLMTLKAGIERINDKEVEKKKLLEKLYEILNDSLILRIDETSKKSYSFFHEKSSIETEVDFDSDKVFGSINLSNIAFSDDKKSTCFYIALQCGSGCGEVMSFF